MAPLNRAIASYAAVVISFAIVFAGPGLVSAQPCANNLVPNPSFDNPQTCPTGWSTIGVLPGYFGIPLGFAGHAPPWHRPTSHAGSSDVYNVCGTTGSTWDMRVPNNAMGGQWPVSGTGYAGVIAYDRKEELREYIEAPLTSPMLPGQLYRVSFNVSLSDKSKDCVPHLGAHLSVGPVTASHNWLALPLVPQIQNTGGPLCDDDNWTLISGVYLAVGGEDHIVIGNFSPDAGMTVHNNSGAQAGRFSRGSYYYIDDVCVTCLCTAPPAIVTHPAPQTVLCGDGATLSGSAFAPCGWSYRWICDDCYATPTVLSNNTLFSGANTSTLQLTSVAAAQFRNKTFRMEAYNDCGGTKSQGASITVIPPPLMLEPLDANVCPPQQQTFSTLGPFSPQYRWYWIPAGQTTPIPFAGYQGGFSPTLDFITTPAHCGAQVFCDVIGPCGTTRTRYATIECCDCEPPPPVMGLWLPLDSIDPIYPATDNAVAYGYRGELRPSRATGPGLWKGEYVGNSFYFDGVDDLVRVRHHDLIDIQTGSFTIDAWVFQDGFGSVGAPQPSIVEKWAVASDGREYGYRMYLQGDASQAKFRLGFEMADGSMRRWVATPTSALPYGWSHIAVVVQRAGTPRGELFVNGVSAGTFNPGERPGSLSNDSPLVIGARTSPVADHFWGGIDEVEVFGRALSASEILAIYRANGIGKCKQFCQVPFMAVYCGTAPSTTVGAYLFNFAPNPATFTGGFYPGTCLFTPSNFPVAASMTLPSSRWNSTYVSATRPGGMSAFDQACFDATFSVSGTGKTVSDRGVIVYRPDITCSGDTTMSSNLALHVSEPISLGFGNAAMTRETFEIQVFARGPDGLPSQAVSLNGGAPGEPYHSVVHVPIGSEHVEVVETAFVQIEALGVTTLVLATDVDGDGNFEPAAVRALTCHFDENATPCAADYNRAYEAGDILDLLDFFEDFGTCQGQPMPCGIYGSPDVNGDTMVDILDLLDFLGLFAAGC